MRTEGLSILAALALHGGVLLVAKAMPPLALLQTSDVREIRTIDIEIPTALPDLPPPPTPEKDPEPAARTPEADRAPDARVARASAPVAGPQGPAPSETASPDNRPPPGPNPPPTQFDELPPEGRQGVLGVPGVPGLNGPAWAVPGVLPPGAAAAAPAPTVAPAPREVPRNIGDKVLGDAIAAKDKDIGLDLPLAGTVRTAVRTAIMSSDIPTGSKGTIACTISPSGAVTGCKVQSSRGGGSESWAVATRAAAAVAGAALPGRYAHGAIVVIDISVVQTPPAGGKGGFTGTGANFDISNIGAHSTRQVRTSHRVQALP